MKMYPVHFDPRSKLCVIVIASVALMVELSLPFEVALIGLFAFFLIASGYMKKAVVFLGVFLGLLWANQLVLAAPGHPIAVLIDFLMVGNRRLLPTIMAASFTLSGTKVSEWLAALQKLHLPMQLIVPLAVLFRFFPMAIQEISHIRQAMKFRGIATTPWQLIRHPLQSMEYVIIPLLLSAEETSLNLSATALVRGLANPKKHTSVHELQLKGPDYALMGSLLGCLVVRMWIG